MEGQQLRSYADEVVEQLTSSIDVLTSAAQHCLRDGFGNAECTACCSSSGFKRQPDLRDIFLPLIEPLMKDEGESIRERERPSNLGWVCRRRVAKFRGHQLFRKIWKAGSIWGGAEWIRRRRFCAERHLTASLSAGNWHNKKPARTEVTFGRYFISGGDAVASQIPPCLRCRCPRGQGWRVPVLR